MHRNCWKHSTCQIPKFFKAKINLATLKLDTVSDSWVQYRNWNCWKHSTCQIPECTETAGDCWKHRLPWLSSGGVLKHWRVQWSQRLRSWWSREFVLLTVELVRSSGCRVLNIQCYWVRKNWTPHWEHDLTYLTCRVKSLWVGGLLCTCCETFWDPLQSIARWHPAQAQAAMLLQSHTRKNPEAMKLLETQYLPDF